MEVKNIQNGIIWKAFDGSFPWVPSVATLTSSETGIAKQPGINVRGTKINEVLYFDGYIRVPADGEYSFYITANNGALLRLHNAVVVDADFKILLKKEI